MRITQHSKHGSMKPSLTKETAVHRKDQLALGSHANLYKNRFPKNTSSPFGTTRRKEHIHQNLLHAKGFVKLQVDSLKEMESTIILWANNLNNCTSHAQVNSLFSQPISRLTKLTYKEIPLFGNGTESPLKIYYQKDGQRELLEFQVLPLLSEPAFSQIPFVCKTKCTITPGMLHASCGEIMGNHVIAESKLNQIEDVISNLYPLDQVSRKGSLVSFLQRFFRRNSDHFSDPASLSARSSNHQITYQLRGAILD